MTFGDLMKFVAETIGIADRDVAFAPWLSKWIENNREHLRYDNLTFRWYWRETDEAR